MAKHLQTELETIKNRLLNLSGLVERSLEMAIKSLNTFDVELANQVNLGDYEIDLKEVELEEECLKALALYQPVAVDLRFIVVALKINNDLERMGDMACSLASRARYLAKLPRVEVPFDFELMSTKSIEMVKNSIDSLIKMDANLARKVCLDDDEVDKINKATYPVVFERIRKNPDTVEQNIHYLSISRFLERISDLATNIAEDIIYMIDGVIVRHNPEGKSKSIKKS